MTNVRSYTVTFIPRMGTLSTAAVPVSGAARGMSPVFATHRGLVIKEDLFPPCTLQLGGKRLMSICTL